MSYEAETRILPVNPAEPEEAIIAEAAAVIARGGLVAFPTETVYGLGAHALNAEAVARIFAAKERPGSDPLIVHIAEVEQLAGLTSSLPFGADVLADLFWPGPLTMVMEKSEQVPLNVTAGGSTVAIRMPAHPVALALIRAAGPIAAPSANRFSRPSPTTAAHVAIDLMGSVDLILDGGPVRIGVESTVINLTAHPPVVLRPGGTPVEKLRALLPDLVVQERFLDPAQGSESPGQMLKHYSPDADVILYDGDRDKALKAMRVSAAAMITSGESVGVMLVEEDIAAFEGIDVAIVSLGTMEDIDHVAQRLFAALRELDALGVHRILARALPTGGLGLAIRDRLLRAAEGRVITIR